MTEISNLSFRYREGAEPILHGSGIDLAIPDGSFVGITGAAGSGKSTLTWLPATASSRTAIPATSMAA